MVDTLNTANIFRNPYAIDIEPLYPPEVPLDITTPINLSKMDRAAGNNNLHAQCTVSVSGSVEFGKLYENLRYIVFYYRAYYTTSYNGVNNYSNTLSSTTRTINLDFPELNFNVDPVQGTINARLSTTYIVRTINSGGYMKSVSVNTPLLTLTNTTSINEEHIIKPTIYQLIGNSISPIPLQHRSPVGRSDAPSTDTGAAVENSALTNFEYILVYYK